jgi:hypothetical protein
MSDLFDFDAPVTAPKVDPIDFLEMIWGPPGSWHSLCWKAAGDDTAGLPYKVFNDPGELAAHAATLLDVNVWVGINAMAERPSKRGGAPDVTHSAALFVDLDWKDDAHADPDKYPTEDEVRERLAAFNPAPTHVVCSGHGLQAYWSTLTPMKPKTTEELQSRLSRALTDAGLICEAMDLPRILRLPGSTNHKLDPKPVVLESATAGYTVTELDKRLPKIHERPATLPTPKNSTPSNSGPGPIERVLEQLDLRAELLQRGFEPVGDDGKGELFKRPNATNAQSVRINPKGRLHVFSESLPLPASATNGESTYDALDVIAAYRHGTGPSSSAPTTTERTDAARDIAASLGVEWSHEAPATAEAPTGKAPPARDALVDIAEEHYVIGRLDDERTYLVPLDGPNVALLRGDAKADLARRYRKLTGKTTGRAPLDEAWMTIEGIAHTAAKQSLPIRVGSTANGSPVIDLADTTGRAIVVSIQGWAVVDRSPITFRRSKAMLPLDEPVTGGSTAELFELLNVDPSNRALFAAWMTSALFDTLPHPAPVLTGTQGTTKSSTARGMTKLIDPCLAATQKPPKSEDEWAMTCSARWMVAVDNVSNVSEWWSDAVCRTITGDGWLRRALYTDDDAIATSWRRCVILNGITLGAKLRPDLAERLVLFELQRPTEWLTEREVDARLDDMRPRVLGALLDLAVDVIGVWPTTETVSDLRMADFATFLAAHDNVTGADALVSYRRQLDTIFDEALESDDVAVAVVEFMEHRNEWRGTARQLLAELMAPLNMPPEWPTNARQLSNAMSRSAAMLHKIGITWELGRKTKAGRLGTLTRTETPDTEGDEGDVGDDKSPLLHLDVNEERRAA